MCFNAPHTPRKPRALEPTFHNGDIYWEKQVTALVAYEKLHTYIIDIQLKNIDRLNQGPAHNEGILILGIRVLQGWVVTKKLNNKIKGLF